MEKTLRRRRDIDMTEGPILINLIRFLLPVMATNLLQTFYNTADMMIVGFSGVPDAVGAIGATGAFVGLVLNLFIGFSIGTDVVVGQAFGARDPDRVSRAVRTAVVLGVVLGTLVAVLGQFISRPILILMGADRELLDLAVLYTKIYFLSCPFSGLLNYACAIIRARGDSRTPLIVLSASGLLNLLLNILFVLGFHRSVDGVAWATVISTALAALVMLVVLLRDKGPCHFSFKNMRPDARALRDIVLIGFPAGLQNCLASLSNMIVQSSIIKADAYMCGPAPAYHPVVKGNSAVANLEGIVSNAASAAYTGSINFVSQNAGAGKIDRARRAMWASYLIGTVLSLAFSGLVFLLRYPLLALYDVRPGAPGTLEAFAWETAMKRLWIGLMPYFLVSWMNVSSGVLRGLGHSIFATAQTLIAECGLRVLWVLTVFPALHTIESIYVSYPITRLLTAILGLAFSLHVLRRIEEKLRERKQLRSQREGSDDATPTSPTG